MPEKQKFPKTKEYVLAKKKTFTAQKCLHFAHSLKEIEITEG